MKHYHDTDPEFAERFEHFAFDEVVNEKDQQLDEITRHMAITATLLGCLWTAKLRTKWLTPLPTTIVNGVMVGAMLAAVYTPDAFWQGFLMNGLQVAAGELAVMVILGLPLAVWLEKSKVLKRLTIQVRTFA